MEQQKIPLPMSYQQINDSLYELHAPATGEPPTMEILFFHGLQQPDQEPKDAFWKTWTSGDECWPKTWLPDEGNFPNARILAVSYDASVRSSAKEGRLELFNIGEYLVQDIICSDFANVGRRERCPVFLVGHCLGGLVLKQLIVVAQSQVLHSDTDPSVKSFLSNIGGIFYFSTPNFGADIANFAKYFSHASPVVSILSVLNDQVARLNNGFRRWRSDNKVKAYAVAESDLTRVGRSHVLIVSEASARYDVDMFTLVKGDHFNVCAPQQLRNSSSLHILRDFIRTTTDQKLREHDMLVSLMSDVSFHPGPVTLPFASDARFVHLESSFTHVKAALEAEQGQVVTLYGEPGLGKSCMAKYVALYYQQSNSHFLDGVWYLECGPRAQVLAEYAELWQNLLPEGPQASLESAQLVKHLRNKSLLIVLDNVCEPEILGKLLLPGKGVKYLVTSQIRGIWKDAKAIRMQTPTLEEALKILVHRLNISEFPQCLQEVMDAIIREWNFNPSMLASLAMAMGSEKAQDPEEWKMASKDLMELVLEDPFSLSAAPVLYRTVYRRDISMMNTLNALPPQAQCLLFLTVMCDAPDIPEMVLHIFFNIVESEPTSFIIWKEVLEDHSLIQIDNNTVPWSTERQCLWSTDKFAKQAIKAKKKHEVGKCMDALLSNSDNVGTVPLVDTELLAALCLEYGDEGLRRRAGQKLVLSTGTIASMKDLFRPYVWTLLAEIEKRESNSRLLASEVFIRHMSHQEISNKDLLPMLPGALDGSVKLMMETKMHSDMWEKAADCLVCLAGKVVENEVTMVTMAGTLEELVNRLWEHATPELQENAALCLSILASDPANQVIIASIPSALEGLVHLLQKHGSHERQRRAVMCLGILACNAENRVKIASIPGTLEASVTLLWKAELPALQEQAARCLGNLALNSDICLAIGWIPGALEALLKLLETDEKPGLLERAANCLHSLSKHDAIYLHSLSKHDAMRLKIVSTPGLLEATVKLLLKDESPLLQETMASFWSNIALAVEKVTNMAPGVPEIFPQLHADKIASVPGALEALVKLLGKEGNWGLQEEAARCLGILARNAVTQVKIVSIECALEALVKLLWEDGSSTLQDEAVRCLANLALYVENRVKIESIDGAVEALEKLLSEDGPLYTQRNAALCLYRLKQVYHRVLLTWLAEG